MTFIEDAAEQVKGNCLISDARHAGAFSVCGLALRLRDLYKWEKGLPPWVEGESQEVLDWIGRREESWEGLEEDEFTEILIQGRSYDPFDVEGVNREVEPMGYFYGAGLARGLKPVFFLARIEERREVSGRPVYVLGEELARDLLTLPALTRDGVIVVRKESARVYLWDQISYLGKSGRPALRFALAQYGLVLGDYENLPLHMDRILSDEVDIYVHHELGEIAAGQVTGEIWPEMVGAFAQTPCELAARAVKDMLADTHEQGTLEYIVRRGRKASLGFYAAFLDGLRKELFPELRAALMNFMNCEDWGAVEDARRKAYEKAARHAEWMVSAFRRSGGKGDSARARIERHILEPLGIHAIEP